MIPNLAVLGTLVRDIHQGLTELFYVMLPIAIVLYVVIGYLKSGDTNIPDVLKRAFVAALLLASFPEVSNVILDVCDGIALKIDDMSGLETFTRMAGEKMQSYSGAKSVLLLQFDDFFMAILSFVSFVLVYISRYITIALYYFYWTILSICSPLMILCYVFPTTANVTANLYKGLIEVACWKILWAIMSAMLTSLSFGNIYQTQGSYVTLMILNFVIAIGLLFTPMLMKSLITQGIEGTATTLGTTAASAMIAVPARIVSAKNITQEVVSNTRLYAQQKLNSLNRKL